MPTPVTPVIPPQFNWVTEWEEKVADFSPSTFQFDEQSAQVTVTGMVSWDRAYYCMCYAKGFSYVSTNDMDRISRVLPIRHPWYQHLYCTSVTCQEFGYDGKQNLQFLEGSLQAASQYKKCMITLTFTQPKYKIKKDNEITKEYERYITVDIEEKTEALERSSGNMKYAEGPKIDKGFAGLFYSYETRTYYNLRWHQVPLRWIADTEDINTMPLFTNIRAAVGKVNSDTFLNKEPGTLLLLEPKYTIYKSPLVFSDKSDYWYVDVFLPLVYFNPELGAGTPIQKGHNNKPLFLPSETSTKYYYATSGGAPGGVVTGAPLYQSAPFADMFRRV